MAGKTARPVAPAPPPSRPRSPAALRLLVEYAWLLGLPLFAGVLWWVLRESNQYDLEWVPMPGLLKVAVAGGIVGLILLVPYLILRGPIDRAREDLTLLRDAKAGLKDARRRLRGHGHRLGRAAREQVEGAIAAVEAGVRGDQDLAQGLSDLETALEEHLSFARKGQAREYAESIGVAVFIALLLRAFVVEAFKIPSGSMIPTLQVGDHIFVNKFIYGVRVPWTEIKLFDQYRFPKRGEVVVFVYPREPDKDFIKRIVAVSGDTVDLRGNQIYVNGEPLPQDPIEGPCSYEDYDEGNGEWHTEQCEANKEKNGGYTYTTINNPHSSGKGGAILQFPLTVPPRSVFVMGDNRDNSHDSRYWGYVPYDKIKGKAWIIWWSAGKGGSVRLERMFKLIHP